MRLRLIRSVCRAIGVAFSIWAATAMVVAAGEIEEIRDVTYAVRGKNKLQADIFVPKGPGPFPGVLCVHGGAWMAGSRSGHMELIAVKLAEHGYTTATIDYRLAPQYTFPAQIEDCRSAVRWMRDDAARYKIDPKRIAGFGYSAGAQLVSLLGATDGSYKLPGEAESKTSARLQAVVAGGAPLEFRIFPSDDRRLAYWLGGSRAEKPEAYDLASPLKYVAADNPPMFFYHGQKDALVPLLSPEAMVKALTVRNVRASLYVVPEASHIQAFFDTKAVEESIKFLDEEMKAGQAVRKETAEPQPAGK